MSEYDKVNIKKLTFKGDKSKLVTIGIKNVKVITKT